jgi:hypothetical protein
MHRAMVLSRGPLLSTSDFPIHVSQLHSENRETPATFIESGLGFERAIMMHSPGRVACRRAPQTCSGMSERHLRYKLKKHDIRPS